MSSRLNLPAFIVALSLASFACGGGTTESSATSAEPAESATPAEASSTETGAPAEAPAPAADAAAPAPATPQPAPVIVVETEKGTFEFETYPDVAPKTVEQITTLVRRRFYNGQRFHRVEPGFIVQWGDPNSKDMRKQLEWGNGGSGKPIGVAEISPKLKHRLGTVAMANPGGNAKLADSQMYVVIGNASHLDGGYTIFGQVTSGLNVVQKIAKGDVVKRMSIKGE